MKIYLSARYSRREELRGYRAELEAAGHVVNARWLDVPKDHPDCMCIDYADVVDCDALLNFTEEPGSYGRAGGRHVEFGMAVALGKKVLVIGHIENIFHRLPSVCFFADWCDAMESMERIALAGR